MFWTDNGTNNTCGNLENWIKCARASWRKFWHMIEVITEDRTYGSIYYVHGSVDSV